METDSPEMIFDRRLLARRRARFAAEHSNHDFLLRRAVEDIAARLDTVVREFPVAASLGSHPEVAADVLARHPRVGQVVQAEASPPQPTRNRFSVACDEEALPFAQGSLDLVVSGLSLHLVNDLPGALVQIRRALKPDGLFLAAVLGGGTLNELREALAVAEEEIDGGVSPRVAPFADVRDYGALLQRAGFALPVADTDVVQATYVTPFELMREVRAMGGGNVLTERRRKPMTKAMLMRAAEVYTERFPAPGGRVTATFEIIHLTGWSPDPSQPKPLAPGSARARLADALGTKEVPSGVKAGPSTGKKK